MQDFEFPSTDFERRHLARSIQILESEKMDATLRQHGIRRDVLPRETPFFHRHRYWLLAAAALVALLLAVIILTRQAGQNPAHYAESQLVSVAADYNPALRSGTGTGDLEAGKMAFGRGDWQAANRSFDLALSQTPTPDARVLEEIYFYKGVIYLERKDFAEAAGLFAQSLETGGGRFQKDARWLRGLALVKSGDPEAALPDLQKTAAERGWIKADAARKLVEMINRAK